MRIAVFKEFQNIEIFDGLGVEIDVAKSTCNPEYKDAKHNIKVFYNNGEDVNSLIENLIDRGCQLTNMFPYLITYYKKDNQTISKKVYYNDRVIMKY